MLRLRLPHFSLLALILVASTLFASSAFAQGKTYYVSNSGNDRNNGLSAGSPWQTVAHVNNTNLQPGDTVLFERGSQWDEALNAPTSGTAGNPITFADYGSGAKPKFWGSFVLNNANFQSLGNGIYLYRSATPVYSVLANHAFLNYTSGAPAYTLANSWSYDGTNIMINSPSADPRYDGLVYTAVAFDDVIDSNYQSHLVFNNLVTDESARYDDNGGYGFRIMGSTDVQLNGCEAYHAGKHNFGVINSTQFVGSNLTAAYAAPGQEASGGASAYVSYGDTSTGLFNQTSAWHNITASNMDDPQDNTIYQAFLNHGSTLSSVVLDNLQALGGASVSLGNTDNLAETITMTHGLIQNARLTLAGNGILVDGVELSGPQGTVDLGSSNSTLQNLLIHGTNLGSQWYQTAILSRTSGNTIRFNTIVMDPTSGTNTCLALTDPGEGLSFYANACVAPLRNIALWNFGLNRGTFAQSSYNVYQPRTTFAQYVGQVFNWFDITLPQWQTFGFDFGSFYATPTFVNAASDNYQPAPGSPLLNAAPLPTSLLQTIPTDFAGNSRLVGTAFDIGALAAAATPAAPVATYTTLTYNNSVLLAMIAGQSPTGSGTPTGSVSFYDGSQLLNTVVVSNRSAYTGVALDPTQGHSLTATYTGDAHFSGSTSSAITVNPIIVIAPPAPTPAPTPTPAPNPTPITPVTTAPAAPLPITLISPVNGATVSGPITLTAVTTLNLDAAGSYVLVDGQRPDSFHLTSAPYVYPLDTTRLPNGTHTLQLWAHDIGNNTWLSNTVTVTVSN